MHDHQRALRAVTLVAGALALMLRVRPTVTVVVVVALLVLLLAVVEFLARPTEPAAEPTQG